MIISICCTHFIRGVTVQKFKHGTNAYPISGIEGQKASLILESHQNITVLKKVKIVNRDVTALKLKFSPKDLFIVLFLDLFSKIY